MKHLLYILALSGVVTGCAGTGAVSSEAVTAEAERLVTEEDVLSFLVIGDFGRNGQFRQQETAVAMQEAAHALDIEFVVTTGDNFYDNGVASVHDPIFRSAYEDVYSGANLLVDWFATLGNHEYRGNVQAVIDYTDISRRWNQPARYYARSFELEDEGTLDIFFLDTSPLQGSYYEEAKYASVVEQDSSAQMAWLDAELARSTADWKMVVGHHPLLTGGNRRDDEREVAARLEPILARHKVHAYFSGHEHDLQHLVSPRGVHQFISGAGSELRPTGVIPETRFALSENGFMAVSVQQSHALVQVVDWTGRVLYTTRLEP